MAGSLAFSGPERDGTQRWIHRSLEACRWWIPKTPWLPSTASRGWDWYKVPTMNGWVDIFTYMEVIDLPTFGWLSCMVFHVKLNRPFSNHGSVLWDFESWSRGDELIIRCGETSSTFSAQTNSARSWWWLSGWWFEICFIFIPTGGNHPIWLIFFKWVDTTN